MKFKFLFTSLAFISTIVAQTVNITFFGADADVAGGWTYNAGASQITGTESLGDIFYGAPLNSNITGTNAMTLTINVVSGSAPANGFTFVLLNADGINSAEAIFDWATFVGGATVTRNFTTVTTGFDPANITDWNIIAGGAGTAINATFTSASATFVAVPEPSSLAALAGLGALAFIGGRRKRNI